MTSAVSLKSLCSLHMQCTAAPSLEHRASCVLHFVLLVFVYTEVRTLEVLGVMTRTMILRITILAIWVSTPHLVLWRITRCSCLCYTSHRCCCCGVLALLPAGQRSFLGSMVLVSYSLPRAHAKVHIATSDLWIRGVILYSTCELHRMCGACTTLLQRTPLWQAAHHHVPGE